MHATLRATGSLASVADAIRRLEQVAKRTGADVQMVDADLVYNERHVRSAVEHAVRAVAEGRGSARSLAAEFLLYLTGERQVRRALEVAGVRAGTSAIVFVAFGAGAERSVKEAARELDFTPETTPLAPNPRALERLGVKDELAVLQKVALLDLLK